MEGSEQFEYNKIKIKFFLEPLDGKSIEILALEIVTLRSSSGCRMTSRTVLLNSGNSSKNRTPLLASEISPGCGIPPPPTKASLRAITTIITRMAPKTVVVVPLPSMVPREELNSDVMPMAL